MWKLNDNFELKTFTTSILLAAKHDWKNDDAGKKNNKTQQQQQQQQQQHQSGRLVGGFNPFEKY